MVSCLVETAEPRHQVVTDVKVCCVPSFSTAVPSIECIHSLDFWIYRAAKCMELSGRRFSQYGVGHEYDAAVCGGGRVV